MGTEELSLHPTPPPSLAPLLPLVVENQPLLECQGGHSKLSLPHICTLSPACRIWEPGAQHRGRPGLLCLLCPGGHPSQRGLPQPPGHRAACPPDHAGEVGGPAQTLPGKVLPPHSPTGTESVAGQVPQKLTQRQSLASRVLEVNTHGRKGPGGGKSKIMMQAGQSLGPPLKELGRFRWHKLSHSGR